MKKIFGKRFHRIPVAMMSVLLVIVLMTGAVFAVNGYAFFEGTVQAQVDEPIALGEFSTWDNLKPYGSDPKAEWEWEQDSWHTGVLGDVAITLGEDPTISIAGIGDYVGAGFVAGEWIVIPLNIRNGGSGSLILSASAETEGELEVDYCWLTNDGTITDTHPDGDLAYDFKDDGNWAPLSGWSEVLEAYEGESGSARLGAQVLFVRIRAPGNTAPVPQFLNITLYRN